MNKIASSRNYRMMKKSNDDIVKDIVEREPSHVRAAKNALEAYGGWKAYDEEFIKGLSVAIKSIMDAKEADQLDSIIKEAMPPLLLLGLCVPLFGSLVACGDLPPTDGSVDFAFKDPGDVGFATHLSLPSDAWIVSRFEAKEEDNYYNIAFPCIKSSDPYNDLGEDASRLVLVFKGKRRPVEKRGDEYFIVDNDQQISASALIAGQWSGGAGDTVGEGSGEYIVEWDEYPEPVKAISHGVSQFGGICVEYDPSTGDPIEGAYKR